MIAEHTIRSIIDAVRDGAVPHVDPENVPCFSAAALKENPVVKSEDLETVLAGLSPADLPTLERALAALRADEQAWLGFKIVTDAAACTSDDPGDDDTPISKNFGPSAEGESALFFANEDSEIVCAHPWNDRDRFQMLDITRGPAMHKDQFAGVTWVSTPLFRTKRAVIYGAGDVSAFLARYARDCDFDTLVIDDDLAFLNEGRFAQSELVRVSADWSDLASKVTLTEDDYCVCVSRGHEHDVLTLAFSLKSDAAYVGMMGHPTKNAQVFEMLQAKGVTAEDLARVHAPIGVKIADKTPAEIAVSIVAELIDVRGKKRKPSAGQADHGSSTPA